MLLATTASALIVRNYDTDKITVKKVEHAGLAGVAPGGQARVVTAEVHVDHQGLPRAYDALRVAIVGCRAGGTWHGGGCGPTTAPPT